MDPAAGVGATGGSRAGDGAAPSRRIRVVEVIDDAAVGGGQRHLLDLAAGLDPVRFEVAVICEESGWLVDELRRLGIPLLPVRMGNRPDPGVFLRLRRHLRRFGADLVHTHGGTAGFHGRLAAISLGLPVVHTYHGLHALRNRGGIRAALFRTVDRHLAARTAQLVCVSKADAVLARAEQLAPPDRCAVVPNGIRVRDYAHVAEARQKRHQARPAGEGTVVGTMGRLNPEKGHLCLVEAAALVRRRRPDLRFAVVGAGPEERRLRRRAQELGLGEALEFQGVRHDPAEVLSAFDLFVLPSLWEGHPIVLLEAAAAGLPVIASDIEGVREVLDDGRTGLLVRPRDPMALAGAILELASDAGRAAAMGQAAREGAGRFDISWTVQTIDRLYRRVLGPGESGSVQ